MRGSPSCLATNWQHFHGIHEQHAQIKYAENEQVMLFFVVAGDSNKKSWVRIPPARPFLQPIDNQRFDEKLGKEDHGNVT
jgi:hypothetical protein